MVPSTFTILMHSKMLIEEKRMKQLHVVDSEMESSTFTREVWLLMHPGYERVK